MRNERNEERRIGQKESKGVGRSVKGSQTHSGRNRWAGTGRCGRHWRVAGHNNHHASLAWRDLQSVSVMPSASDHQTSISLLRLMCFFHTWKQTCQFLELSSRSVTLFIHFTSDETLGDKRASMFIIAHCCMPLSAPSSSSGALFFSFYLMSYHFCFFLEVNSSDVRFSARVWLESKLPVVWFSSIDTF